MSEAKWAGVFVFLAGAAACMSAIWLLRGEWFKAMDSVAVALIALEIARLRAALAKANPTGGSDD